MYIEATDLAGATLSPSQVEQDREAARIAAGAADRQVVRFAGSPAELGMLRAMLFGEMRS